MGQTTLQRTAIDSKDAILAKLNECTRPNMSDELILETFWTVLETLQLTAGMWIELGYWYKAKALSEIMVSVCTEICCESVDENCDAAELRHQCWLFQVDITQASL